MDITPDQVTRHIMPVPISPARAAAMEEAANPGAVVLLKLPRGYAAIGDSALAVLAVSPDAALGEAGGELVVLLTAAAAEAAVRELHADQLEVVILSGIPCGEG